VDTKRQYKHLYIKIALLLDKSDFLMYDDTCQGVDQEIFAVDNFDSFFIES